MKEEYSKFDVNVRNSSYMSSYYQKTKDIIFVFVVVRHIYVSSLRNALLNYKISYNSSVSHDYLQTEWQEMNTFFLSPYEGHLWGLKRFLFDVKLYLHIMYAFETWCLRMGTQLPKLETLAMWCLMKAVYECTSKMLQ
jgi:hypothetical protein